MSSFYPDVGPTAAFDASGKEEDQRVVVIAGFVSSAKDWISFSDQWQKRLAVDGFSYFHMVEFAHSEKHFAKLKGQERKRRALLNDLMEIIIGHVYRKFALNIRVPDFVTGLDEEFRKKYYLTTYSLLGRVIAAEAYTWHREEKWNAPLRLVFETGDDTRELSERLRNDGYRIPDFRPRTDRVDKQGIIEPGYIPLQAADFLAYEFFLSSKRRIEGLDFDARWAWREFRRIAGERGMFSEKSITGARDLFSYIQAAHSTIESLANAVEKGRKERDET